jgi:hypothetical protein
MLAINRRLTWNRKAYRLRDSVIQFVFRDAKSVQRTTQRYHSSIRLQARLFLPQVQTYYPNSSNGLKRIDAIGLTRLPCLGIILAAFFNRGLARRKSASGEEHTMVLGL